jgi:CBS domain-containing protein
LATIDADSPVLSAAVKMHALDLGALPVVAHGRLVGMLTDRDITVRVTALGRDATRTTVREVMTPGAITCFDEDELEAAAATMARDGVRRLVVLDADLRAVGMLSVADIAMQADNQRWVAHVLSRVCPTLSDEERAGDDAGR